VTQGWGLKTTVVAFLFIFDISIFAPTAEELPEKSWSSKKSPPLEVLLGRV
jgi:hypothetical protein